MATGVVVGGGVIDVAARRPLVGAALAFTIGVALLPVALSHPGLAFALAWVLGLAAFLLASRAPSLATLAVLLAFVPAGMGAAALRSAASPLPSMEAEALVDAEVVDPGHVNQGRTSFVGRLPDGGLVRFSAAAVTTLLPGDRLQVPARLSTPPARTNPGAPDNARRLQAEGIVATASVDATRIAVFGAPSLLTLSAHRFRREFAALAEQVIEDPQASALVRALALGDRAELSLQTNDDFSVSGLAHILSVSGLHIAVIAAGIYLGIRAVLARSERLLLHRDLRAMASLCAIPVTWGYIALTGSEVPAVRSGVMASALFVARAVGRDVDPASALGLSLLAVLAFDPAALHSPSFQLSFVAVAGLLLLSKPLRDLVPLAPPDLTLAGPRARFERLREVALQGMLTSVAASLATAPIVAAEFHRASLVSVLANLLALPVASGLTAFCALSAVALAFSASLAVPFLLLADPLARLLLEIGHRFAEVPFASLSVSTPSLSTTLLWYAMLAALPLRAASPLLSRRLFRGAAGALGLIALFGVVRPLLSPTLEVTFLSVGQGDATLLRFPGGRTLLIDGGGVPGGHFDPGERIIAPALLELGVRKLDAVALSHPHPDHALGLFHLLGKGMAAELWYAQGTEVRGLLEGLTAAATSHGASVRPLSAGTSLEGFSPARIEVLHPEGSSDLARSVNDSSLVLRVVMGEISFLFPGDLERDGEEQVLATSADLQATVLKAPHHGSKTSSTDAFIRRVAPHHVVFCVGARNRFGFPHQQVADRYREAGCALHRTDLDGAITFRTDGHTLSVEHFLP